MVFRFLRIEILKKYIQIEYLTKTDLQFRFYGSWKCLRRQKNFFFSPISCSPLVVTRRTAPLSVTFVSEQVSVWKFHLFMEELCFALNLSSWQLQHFRIKAALLSWTKPTHLLNNINDSNWNVAKNRDFLRTSVSFRVRNSLKRWEKSIN